MTKKARNKKKETKSQLIATQNNAIRTNYIQTKIDNSQNSSYTVER